MTNKNNGRIAGQNDQKIQPAQYVKKLVEAGASYKLVPIKGRKTIGQLKPQLLLEKQLKALAFVKALNPLLFITYRFTCEKVSYFRCALRHVLHWISGTPPNHAYMRT